MAEPIPFNPGRRKRGASELEPPPPGDGDSIDLVCARFPKNDLGNAQRLIARQDGELMSVRNVGWHGWDGRRWSAEEGPDLAHRAAHETARQIRDEAKALAEDGPWDGEAGADFQERIAGHRRWATGSGNAGRARAMLSEAQPYLTRTIEDLDAEPLLLTCESGTLDLETATLRPHDPADLITRCAPVAWNPEADCPTWRQFLDDVLVDGAGNADAELQEFMRRWLGYCITGATSEQVLTLFYGRGANGKSTLLDMIERLVGDYAMTLPFASLLHDDRKRGSEANPDLARLPGARMVSAVEPDPGSRFSESTLKQLSGGDRLAVRHLHRDFFEFKPQFKMILSFNNRPEIRGADEGIWRRLLMVPFDRVFAPAERDRHLADKLWAEREGILVWLVHAAKDWIAGGLQVPDRVRAATDSYREDSDPVGQFLGDRTLRKPQAYVSARALFDDYEKYCGENALRSFTQTAFGRVLSEKGVLREKLGGYIVYRGIELLPRADDLDGDRIPD